MSKVPEWQSSPEWQRLNASAAYRRLRGDIRGAIEDSRSSISLTREVPELQDETATSLNYLAALYVDDDNTAQAEEAIREAIQICRSINSPHVADDLLILTEVQIRKGQFVEALESAQEALQLNQKRSHSHGASRAQEAIGRIKAQIAQQPPATDHEKGQGGSNSNCLG